MAEHSTIDGCDLCGGAHTNEQHMAHDRRQVRCTEATCAKLIVYLPNPKTGKTVPVDAQTVAATHDHFDGALGHVSHFKTCTKPGRFSKSKRTPPNDPLDTLPIG